MARYRQRNARCDRCGRVVMVECNLDTGEVTPTVPSACETPAECADEYAAGIADRPFDPTELQSP